MKLFARARYAMICPLLVLNVFYSFAEAMVLLLHLIRLSFVYPGGRQGSRASSRRGYVKSQKRTELGPQKCCRKATAQPTTDTPLMILEESIIKLISLIKTNMQSDAISL